MYDLGISYETRDQRKVNINLLGYIKNWGCFNNLRWEEVWGWEWVLERIWG